MANLQLLRAAPFKRPEDRTIKNSVCGERYRTVAGNVLISDKQSATFSRGPSAPPGIASLCRFLSFGGRPTTCYYRVSVHRWEHKAVDQHGRLSALCHPKKYEHRCFPFKSSSCAGIRVIRRDFKLWLRSNVFLVFLVQGMYTAVSDLRIERTAVAETRTKPIKIKSFFQTCYKFACSWHLANRVGSSPHFKVHRCMTLATRFIFSFFFVIINYCLPEIVAN